MKSIIQQEREEAVRHYSSQISMCHADELEDTYNKGISDGKKFESKRWSRSTWFFIGFVLSLLLFT